MKRHEQRLSVHKFTSFENLTFDPAEYSDLKFGCDRAARKFGTELADKLFAEHSAFLLANRCVVIPSPYNFVQNAASVMARHFTNRLNHHLVSTNGTAVEWSVIHRKVSYVNDYGFLPKEQRRALIDNDEFHFNSHFVEGKVLLFIDDVVITGTHEDKLREIMDKARMTNPSLFLYYGEALPGVEPETEAKLNFAGLSSVDDYIKLAQRENHHVIVRPIKYLMSASEGDFDKVLKALPFTKLIEIYHGALGEGYHRIPSYQTNFNKLRSVVIGQPVR